MFFLSITCCKAIILSINKCKDKVLSDLNGPIEVKKYHPKMFVLDVSTEMPNLSANADRPITGNVLKCQFENTHI